MSETHEHSHLHGEDTLGIETDADVLYTGCFTRERIEKNIPRLYLALALLIGIVLSVLMPFFNEPDGQYHYIVSSTIAGLTPDISRYGETQITTGMDGQRASYKDGTRFEKYYLTKMQLISPQELPRNTDLGQLNYNFFGHLVPAAGVWLGYHIYPSMGVTITVARLFSMLVMTFCMYFVLKRLKKARLLFAVVFLSPVVLNAFSSLSYDSLGYVLSAAFLAFCVNLLARAVIRARDVIYACIWIVSLVFCAKTNFVILACVFPFVAFYCSSKVTDNIKCSFHGWLARHNKKIVIAAVTLVIAAAAVGVVYWICIPYGGLLYVLQRFFATISYRYNTGLNDINQWLAIPYYGYNNMPIWTTCVWYLLIFLTLFVTEKFFSSRAVRYSSLLTFILLFISTYFAFLQYGSGGLRWIQGTQGRYFTPSLLLLAIYAGDKKIKVRLNSYKSVCVFALFTVVVTNTLLVTDTLIGMMR
jgi:uncharacterized membrane protein